MIHEKKRQFRIIQEPTAESFERRLNQTMDELTLARAEEIQVDYQMAQGFCAFIQYKTEVRIAEDIIDEFRLMGESYYCQDCAYFKPSTDRRIKFTTCGRGVIRCAAGHQACLAFYEELAKERGITFTKGGTR